MHSCTVVLAAILIFDHLSASARTPRDYVCSQVAAGRGWSPAVAEQQSQVIRLRVEPAIRFRLRGEGKVALEREHCAPERVCDMRAQPAWPCGGLDVLVVERDEGDPRRDLASEVLRQVAFGAVEDDADTRVPILDCDRRECLGHECIAIAVEHAHLIRQQPVERRADARQRIHLDARELVRTQNGGSAGESARPHDPTR